MAPSRDHHGIVPIFEVPPPLAARPSPAPSLLGGGLSSLCMVLPTLINYTNIEIILFLYHLT